MTESDDLYALLKDELSHLTSPLFDFAQGYVRKAGAFLPIAATMKRSGEVVLQAATDGRDTAAGPDILPLLHDALRAAVRGEPTKAVAVCEWVKITPSGQRQTDAIKVLVEHESGFCGAYYLPCRHRLFRGWEFGDVFIVKAEPEVNPWQPERAT